MSESQKNEAAVALGRLGGRAKVSKGFASQHVIDKALATRRANAAKKKNEVAQNKG